MRGHPLLLKGQKKGTSANGQITSPEGMGRKLEKCSDVGELHQVRNEEEEGRLFHNRNTTGKQSSINDEWCSDIEITD